MAAQWGAHLVCADPAELATHRQVDVVTVAGPVPGHDDLVRTALSAGKHVFCEWPLSTNVRAAAELRDLAARSGGHQVVGLRGRADPGARFARDLLAHGEIGEVLGVTLSAAPASPSESTVDEPLLTGDGGQALDVLRFCLGEPAELSATLTTRCPGVPGPDQVLVQGLLESGVAISAHLQSGAPGGTGFRMEVQGRRGALVLVSPSRIGEHESTVLLARRTGGGTSAAAATPGAATPGAVALGAAPPGATLLGVAQSLEVVPVPESYRSGVAAVPAGPAQGVARLYAELLRAVRTGTPQDPDFTTAVGLHCLLDTVAAAASTRRCRSFG